jgi:hypothetical protein
VATGAHRVAGAHRAADVHHRGDKVQRLIAPDETKPGAAWFYAARTKIFGHFPEKSTPASVDGLIERT